jgi:hypothetical protein
MATLTNCKTCGKEVSSSANVCPNCGEKLKMGFFKKLLLGVGGFIILLILVGIFAGKHESTSTKKEEPVYTVDVEGVGKVKGIIRSNVGLAIGDIKKTKTLGDNRFAQANAQGEFIVIRLIVSNNQNDAITMDANSFKIIDDKNREFSHSTQGDMALAASSNKKEIIFLKKINPGITTDGYLVFDVPSDISGAKLQVRGGLSGEKGMLPIEVQKVQ